MARANKAMEQEKALVALLDKWEADGDRWAAESQKSQSNRSRALELQQAAASVRDCAKQLRAVLGA